MDHRWRQSAVRTKLMTTRHIACLSGGLDSSVMALYLSGHLPGVPRLSNIEYVFTDPGMEDPRTYAMLEALEVLAGIKITRLYGPTWDQALEANAWFLPFHRARWCTPTFKIRPFEAYIGQDHIISYIGLRADEPERIGYLGDKGTHITPHYPLREMQITRADVERQARRAGLPEPALWSCACCPFKTHYLQTIMIETQPHIAEWMAHVEEEKVRHGAGGYTWIRGYTMRQLIANPSLRASIRRRYWATHHSPDQRSLWENEPEETACLMCQVK